MRLDPKEELAAFGRFLAAPRPIRQGDPVARDWPLRCICFVATLLMVNIVLSLVIDRLTVGAGLASKWPDHPTWPFFFQAVVLAPVAEELLFRGGLRLPAYSIYIGPALCVAVFGPGSASVVAAGVIATVSLILAVLHWAVALRKPGGAFGFQRRFVAHYGWTFWGYCALFAIAHAGNYTWSGWRGVVVVLEVLPQFVSGLVLGYLRLRDGLRSSVLAHLLNNAIGMGLLALGSG